AVLAPASGGADTPTHRDTDARRAGLRGGHRHADVEYGIGRLEPGRAQCARQHDGLSRDAVQRACRVHHRVRAMGDDHPGFRTSRHGRPDRLAILVVHFQAVLAHQRDDLELEAHAPLAQDLAEHGLAYLEATDGIEIDLVDGPARGQEYDLHRYLLD